MQARELLASMARFARSGEAGDFEPARWQTTFSIAANAFQCDVLLPPLMVRLHKQALGVALLVMSLGIPSLEMLRNAHCQLVISPRPPDGVDILQKRLFEDTYRVFYDPEQRAAPTTKAEYLAAEHITVIYEPSRALDVDQWLLMRGGQRHFKVMLAPALSSALTMTSTSALSEPLS